MQPVVIDGCNVACAGKIASSRPVDVDDEDVTDYDNHLTGGGNCCL
jgi:uncharacterized metal-binding protein